MEISFSRDKIIRLIIYSSLCVVAGILLEVFANSIKISTWNLSFKRFIAFTLIIFGILGVFVNWNKLALKYPALIINDNGVLNNSDYMNVGLIKWSDIIDITIFSYRNNKLLIILVRNDANYIRGNAAKKALLYFYKFYYKSPIVISTSTIDIEIEKLRMILLEKYQSTVPNS